MKYVALIGTLLVVCLMRDPLRGEKADRKIIPGVTSPIITVPVAQESEQPTSDMKLDCICRKESEKSYPVVTGVVNGK